MEENQTENKIQSKDSQKISGDSLILPMVPLRDVVVFPHTELVLSFGRPKSITAVEKAFAGNKLIFLSAQKNPQLADPQTQDIYKIGTICRVERLLRTSNEVNALIKGLDRGEIISANFAREFPIVKVKVLKEIPSPQGKNKALAKLISDNLKSAVNLGKPIDFLIFMKLMSGVSEMELTDQVASLLDISAEEKQKILEETNISNRLKKVSELLIKETKVLEIEQSIASKTQKKFDKSMKEAVLRERMKTIQKELGEEGEVDPEVGEFKKKLKKIIAPEEVKEKIEKEISRLANMPAYNPESGYIRNWLDWVISLPWGNKSDKKIDNKKAEKILNDDHYGLEKVKERILEFLSVMNLKEKQKDLLPNKENFKKSTTILCFVGPPGVGKTSIGKSIAKALGREFVKISIGGIKDEAEIRGHRRTYVGAMPGRIIKGIKDAKTSNPVFMLDEIDKIGNDYRGDPSAALLEALDPEQNFAFSDHYLEVPYDLSDVLFITTANILDTIPPALRDRLEIISFSGYTPDEKFNIGSKYLYKKTRDANGLLKDQVIITPTAQRKIISDYTKEAGVRGLEREFNQIMRKVARKIDNDEESQVKVSNINLADYLGPKKFINTLAEIKDDIGICTGLAWTQVGGDILFIEVASMPGKGRLEITGQLGDVMKESCKAALSYIRSHWKELGIDKDFYQKYDFHIHVPEGAVPKDGPSAGVTIATALYSVISRKKVKKDVGMTGEITLRGRVLAIGGLKEKLIAAHRAGLKTIVIPSENEKDLVEVPDKVKKNLDIYFSSSIMENFKLAIID